MRMVGMDKKELRKFKRIGAYLFFGVLSTVVNFGSYWVFTRVLGLGAVVASVLSWVAAVLFAYATNRTMVFESSRKGFHEIVRELVAFFGSRLATGAVDWLIMYFFAERLHFNDLYVKIVSNVVVVVLNYILSRFFVFSKNAPEPGTAGDNVDGLKETE